MTYSLDFRKKVLEVRKKENISLSAVAIRFRIGVATVMRWSKDIQAKLTRNKLATKIDMEALKQDIETCPDGYQYERAKRLGVSKACIWYALKRLSVTYKKKLPASKSMSREAIYILSNNQRI